MWSRNVNMRICKPVCLFVHIFERLKHFSHPMPSEDNHYLPFSEVFGTQTIEEHCPSFKKPSKQRRAFPFRQVYSM